MVKNLSVLDPRFATTINNVNSRETYAENASDSQSQDKPSHSKKPNFVRFITSASHEAEEGPKKLFLEAVVIPKRPPFSPPKWPSRRREPELESESDQQGKNIPIKGKLDVQL